MAWPATPLLTFIDVTGPACDAAFLNSLQSGVNGLCLGTTSFKGIAVDGVGAAAATAPAGTVQVSASASGAAITQYALYKEMIPFSWGVFSVVAGIFGVTASINVDTANANTKRVSAGVYQIILKTAVPSTTEVAIIPATQTSMDQLSTGGVIINGHMHSTTQLNLYSQTLAGAASDIDLGSFVIYSL